MDRESYLELESILRDIKAERAKPRHLPFEFFKYITDNFSPDLEVGRGGFGVVYKGVLKYGEIVVVKRLRAAPGTLDKQYENEAHLFRLKHENIVRILGYCSETRQELIQHEGKYCPAHILERLICLEYMPNGSLDRYIKDASSGLFWNQRFKIIEGICCGLHFLHEENQINTPVIHLDLTPANILLTNGMVPKITDFGLSRLFGGQQTRIYTAHNIGKRGYMAPEFWLRGKITKKSDIFSLGVIILEMITGNKDYPWSNDTMTVQNYVKIEVQKWRARMMEDLSSTFVENNCQHIKKCIEIGLRCVDTDEMKRPTTKEITERLNILLGGSNATTSRASYLIDGQSGMSVSPRVPAQDLKKKEALRAQMEVQRRLHEQLKVQRRVQSRTEALQKKYIHPILQNACELVMEHWPQAASASRTWTCRSYPLAESCAGPMTRSSVFNQLSVSSIDFQSPGGKPSPSGIEGPPMLLQKSPPELKRRSS